MRGGESKFLRVDKFERFQHYTDRRPPWVKFYVDLLDDEEMAAKPKEARLLYCLLLLVAALKDNHFPANPIWVAEEVRMPLGPVKKGLLDLISSGHLLESTERVARADWPSRYVPESLRSHIFDRDGYACLECGSTENLEIDHIVPVSQGGEGVEANLQTLCRSCNRRKRSGGSAEQGARQNATQNAGQNGLDSRSPRRRPRVRGETETETEKTLLPDKPARKQDLLWEAVIAEVGEPQTASERGRTNRALKELRAVGATPADVRARSEMYRNRWQGIELTATALAANWSTFAVNGGRPVEDASDRVQRLMQERGL